MYPGLKKSYKRSFPFRIGTTSYIYPDHIIPNVRAIGGFVDEIELLLFQSKPNGAFPTKEEIDTLKNMGKELDLTYNVHLPTDGSLTDPDNPPKPFIRAIRKAIDLTRPLDPTTWTLHLPLDSPNPDRNLSERLDFTKKNLEILLEGFDPRKISVENLRFPLEWLEPIISDLNLSVCLDIGHLVRDGFDVKNTFETFRDRVSIIHLHGFHNGKDHIPVARFSPSIAETVLTVIAEFSGIVSLEVFSYPHLEESLEYLENTHLFLFPEN